MIETHFVEERKLDQRKWMDISCIHGYPMHDCCPSAMVRLILASKRGNICEHGRKRAERFKICRNDATSKTRHADVYCFLLSAFIVHSLIQLFESSFKLRSIKSFFILSNLKFYILL